MERSGKVVSCRFARPLVAGVSWWIVLFFAGCEATPVDSSPQNTVPVFAGIPPLAYLVEQIGGEHVKVDALVRPGQDPHTFEPTPRQIIALGRAAIFFKIDMPFERVLLEKVREGNRRLRVVDVTQGIQKRMMDASCCPGHDHDHEASGGEPDPHVWLSPSLLAIQAENIAEALCQADPVHRPDYQRNLAALLGRIDAVDRRIRRMLAPYRGRSFYVFHPGFGYFADAYGLKQEAVEAGGRSPAPKQLRALIEKARTDGAKVIFVQPQFAPQSAEAVAKALGGKVVPIDGLAKNVLADIEDIAMKIETALKENSPRRHREHREDAKKGGSQMNADQSRWLQGNRPSDCSDYLRSSVFICGSFPRFFSFSVFSMPPWCFLRIMSS